MSDIKVGDLVIVVRGKQCCGKHGGGIGTIYKVARLETHRRKCPFCGTVAARKNALAQKDLIGYSLFRLLRIPPLGELDEVERKEETPA